MHSLSDWLSIANSCPAEIESAVPPSLLRLRLPQSYLNPP